MSIVAWILVGLIPGFLAGALAAHNRQTARVGFGRYGESHVKDKQE